jgi:hypothetical protein
MSTRRGDRRYAGGQGTYTPSYMPSSAKKDMAYPMGEQGYNSGEQKAPQRAFRPSANARAGTYEDQQNFEGVFTRDPLSRCGQSRCCNLTCITFLLRYYCIIIACLELGTHVNKVVLYLHNMLYCSTSNVWQPLLARRHFQGTASTLTLRTAMKTR